MRGRSNSTFYFRQTEPVRNFVFSLSCRYLWLFLITLSHTLPAQKIHHLDINNGLCTNSLSDLTSDRNGNMWIASYNGIMKYTGTHVKCITKIGSDRYSISAPEMHSITEDQCGNIWLGTTAGLDKINPVTFEIEHYPIRSPFPGSSFVGYIYSVFADRYDFIWLSTDVALFKLDINTGQYVSIPTEKNKYSLPHHSVSYNGFIETDNGLWIYTVKGMAFFDYSTQDFHHRYYNPHNKAIFKDGLSDLAVNSDMAMGNDGKLWFVMDHDILASYDIDADIIDTFSFDRPRGAWNCCHSIECDLKNNIWIGFRHGGVMIFDPQYETFQPLRGDNNNRPIKSDYINSIERSHDGKIFVSHDNGLDIVDLYDLSLRERKISGRNDFINLKYQSGDMAFDEGETSVYLPFYGFGFFRYDILHDTFAAFHTADILGGGVAMIYPRGSKTYVGIQRGLKEINLQENGIQPMTNNLLPDTVSRIRGQVVWYQQDQFGNAFVKKSSGKIFHIRNGFVEQLSGVGFMPNACLSPSKRFFNYLNRDINLVRRDIRLLQDDTIDLQRRLEKVNFSFSNPRHMVDDGQSIWMTGQNGVLRYNYSIDSLSFYTVTNGLSHNFTFSIVIDIRNQLWVGSLGGIDKYNAGTDRFISVYKMKDNAYMSAFGHALCSSKGDLFFQFGNKLVHLDPDLLQAQLNNEATLKINEVRINEKNIDWNDPERLDKLRYNENRLTFIYDIQLNDDVDLISFQYRLNGNDWINNEKRNEINLAGLSSGAYLLEIRGALGSVDNPTQTLSIPFTINPPWWKQWWFLTIIFLLLLAAVWIYFKGRIEKYRKELLYARQISDLESKALRSQMNPHFVFNSLNAIQECIVTGKIDEAYTYLSKFSRLLRMVLEHSDVAEVSLQEELEMLGLFVSLEKLRFKNDMHYQFDIDDEVDSEEIYIPPMLIQPHIENAIWHGLRHKDGEKVLHLIIKETLPGYLEVVIEDNGIGREKAGLIRKDRLGGNNHKSKGKQLSQDRMELLKQTYSSTSMVVTDLYNAKGEASGTKVTLVVPILKSRSRFNQEAP